MPVTSRTRRQIQHHPFDRPLRGTSALSPADAEAQLTTLTCALQSALTSLHITSRLLLSVENHLGLDPASTGSFDQLLSLEHAVVWTDVYGPHPELLAGVVPEQAHALGERAAGVLAAVHKRERCDEVFAGGACPFLPSGKRQGEKGLSWEKQALGETVADVVLGVIVDRGDVFRDEGWTEGVEALKWIDWEDDWGKRGPLTRFFKGQLKPAFEEERDGWLRTRQACVKDTVRRHDETVNRPKAWIGEETWIGEEKGREEADEEDDGSLASWRREAPEMTKAEMETWAGVSPPSDVESWVWRAEDEAYETLVRRIRDNCEFIDLEDHYTDPDTAASTSSSSTPSQNEPISECWW